MAQDLPEGARELERALDGVVVVAGWVAVGSEQGENAYAQIVAIMLPINRVSPVMRLSVPNVGQQWQGNYKYA